MQPILRTVLLLFFSALIATSISARSLSGYERSRSRRAASDQRMAELQALIAMGNGGVGHGMFDPYGAGKKKRSDDYKPYSEEEMRRAQLIHQVLQSLQLTSNDLSDQMSAQ